MPITISPTNQQLFSKFESAIPKSRSIPVSEKKETEEEKIARIVDERLKAKEAEKPNGFSLPVLITSAAGTLGALLLIRKYQEQPKIEKGIFKKIASIFPQETGLKEMLTMGAGTILGGLAGGLIFDKKENAKSKVKESIYQFNNIAIPATILVGLQKWAKTSEKLLNKEKELNWKGKIGTVALAIGGGIPLAALISNTINNNIIDKDAKSKRHIKLSDCLVHIDDIAGAAALSGGGWISATAAKLLPFIYTSCGYQAGNKN